MKVAVATSFIHRAGGVETYVESVLPELVQRGHRVAVWHEFGVPGGADSIVPAPIPATTLGSSGEGSDGFDSLEQWQPDVVFLQGLTRVSDERRLLDIAPTVMFLHAYNGTCISGTKLRRWPTPAPCTRALGPGCLVQYLPRGCGGRSPVTMMESYTAARLRQTLMRECAAVATFSEHMRAECILQGVSPDRVIHLPAFVPSASASAIEAAGPHLAVPSDPDRRWHLAFIGRLEYLKGAALLLEAIARTAAALRSRLTITLVGDGRERALCEQHAARLRDAGTTVTFAGWLPPSGIASLLTTVDLVVVPSIWPEPLGLVGLEAAAAGVPVVAFDVGAIHEWLADGVTGRLIAEPPSADALARGIHECLADPARLVRWGAAAREQSRHRVLALHMSALDAVLAAAAARSVTPGRVNPEAAHA